MNGFAFGIVVAWRAKYVLITAVLLTWMAQTPACQAAWPPEHRADFFVASYDRYVAEVAARGKAAAAPVPLSDGGVPNPFVPMSCPGMVLTQGYGPTDFYMEPAMRGARHFHTGWDLACPGGTQIVSVVAGKAIVNPNGGCGGGASGFGLNVQVQAGNLWIRYGHMSQVRVGAGQSVTPGTVLGQEGSTGCSTGSHLHFEVDRGCPTLGCSIDPANLISLPAGVRR